MVGGGSRGLTEEPPVGIRKARAGPGTPCEPEQASPLRVLGLSIPDAGIGIMALLP